MNRRRVHALITLIAALQLVLQPLAQAAPCWFGSGFGDSCCCDADESVEEPAAKSCCADSDAPEPSPRGERLGAGDCGCVATPEWVTAVPLKSSDEVDTSSAAAAAVEPPTPIRPWSQVRPTVRNAVARAPGVPKPLHLIFQVLRL